MCVCHKKLSNTRRSAPILIILVMAITILTANTTFASGEFPEVEAPLLLVLNNYTSKNNHLAPPKENEFFLLDSKGKIVKRLLLDLTSGCNFPGGRTVSTSGDGRCFVVCSDIEDRITVYETNTGIKVWSLTGIFNSAVFGNDKVYALNQESVFAIDNTGTIVKQARIGGFDIVFDKSGDCLWIVEQDIKKCSLDLKIKMTIDPIHHGACSIDISPDGSVWVADRFVSGLKDDVPKSRLLKISSQGNILKSIDLNISPVCVRVNKSDGSVWITGTRERHRDFSVLDEDWPDTINELNNIIGDETESDTLKYDANGNLILSVAKGGSSIALDHSDGSIWIACRKKIWHYSSKGTNLTHTDVSDGQIFLAVVPREAKSNN